MLSQKWGVSIIVFNNITEREREGERERECVFE